MMMEQDDWNDYIPQILSILEKLRQIRRVFKSKYDMHIANDMNFPKMHTDGKLLDVIFYSFSYFLKGGQLVRLFQFIVYSLDKSISTTQKGMYVREERTFFQSGLIVLLFISLGGQRREFISSITMRVCLFLF